MTITREHLELAALATGKRIAMAAIGRDEFDAIDADAMLVWRPHTNIGDAARLAVKLGMWVNRGMASAFVGSEVVEVVVGHNDTAPDMERAYCEAVTLCAAEIGRRMKEAK